MIAKCDSVRNFTGKSRHNGTLQFYPEEELEKSTKSLPESVRVRLNVVRRGHLYNCGDHSLSFGTMEFIFCPNSQLYCANAIYVQDFCGFCCYHDNLELTPAEVAEIALHARRIGSAPATSAKPKRIVVPQRGCVVTLRGWWRAVPCSDTGSASLLR